MDSNLEMQLSLAIEAGLCHEYTVAPELTGAWLILGLDNAIIALKQEFGYAKSETVLSSPEISGVVAHVTKLGLDNIGKVEGLTLKDYIAVIQKIKQSVIRHSASGPHAYYDFVKNYVSI